MLDRLGGGNQAGIDYGGFLTLLDDILTLGYEADDRVAFLAPGRGIDLLEDLFQPLDLAFRFAAMIFQCLLELLRLGGLRHLRQRLQDLLLGVVNVLHQVKEQIVHGFHDLALGMIDELVAQT